MEGTVLVLRPTEDERNASPGLVAAGLRVLEAATVDEALAVAIAERPQVVIQPASEETAAGGELAAGMAAAGLPRPLVLLVRPAASGADESRRAVWQAADACLAAPVDPEILVLQVRTLLRLWKAEASARRAVEHLVDRRRVQEALREREERLRLAIQSTELGTFDVYPQAGRLMWSEIAKRHFGLPPDAEVDYDTFLRGLHPDDRERVSRLVAEALQSGLGGEHATEFRTIGIDDGLQRWVSARGRVFLDASGRAERFIGVTLDVTERKRVEEALQRSAAVLEQAGRMAKLGAWYVDLADHENLNANPLHWSAQVYRIFGYEPGEVTVSNELFFRHVHPEDRERVVEAVARALAERREYSVEHRILRADGGECTVYEYADVELDSQGVPCRLTGAVQDVTERKRAEESLREREDALRAANQRLAEADRRKDEFIAILSHELRNPLAPIRYALPLLEREGEAAGQARAVIERQVEHLTRLVDDLLDVSRITRGKFDLRREHVTLAAIVGAAVEAASPVIAAARHSLEMAVSDEPIWLHADPPRLAQVVTNLLDNSAKYTGRGGRIALEAGRDGGEAIIRVRDNGIGIGAEELPTVFEMFRQVDGASAVKSGLGIGLGLARRLVEMHGGSIEARSAGTGRGAEFIVRLPVATGPRPAAEIQGAATAGNGGRLKVLVVDDNADLVEMLAMVVEAAGHDVRKALDGASAILAARSYRPDVVLLDLGLPILSGLDVARELRRSPETAHARLIALTGWGQAEDRRKTEEAGFDEHLTKPTTPERLERLLKEYTSLPNRPPPRPW